MKKTAIVLVLVLLAAIFSGCTKSTNVLAWAAPSGGSSVAASKSSGNAAFAEGNYAKAMADFNAAVAASGGVAGSPDSEARYGYVKAYCKNAGLDLAAFLKAYSGSMTPGYMGAPGQPGAGSYMLINSQTLPFGMTLSQLENLANVVIVYLKPIADGNCDGVVPKDAAGLNVNLAFAYMLDGILVVADTNQDGTLEYNLVSDTTDQKIKACAVDANNIWSSWTVSIDGSNKTRAVGDLANAINYLNVAISKTPNGASGTMYPQVLSILQKIQTAVQGV